MKLVFVCGSMEPGKDGVGDYTRCLCGILQSTGHEVAAIALNDPFITEEVETYQQAQQQQILVMRYPSAWSTNKRFEQARLWVEVRNPDWLSLQFVIYSFHRKGIPFGLGKSMFRLGGSRKWHLMFHELWIGMERQAPIKHRIIGRLQKSIIKNLLSSLKPQIIHTQTRFYQFVLNELGWRADLMPLFSNIPFMGGPQEEPTHLPREYRMVLFGHINPGAPVRTFARELSKEAQRLEINPRLILIGRNGPGRHEWVRIFQNEGLPVEVMGEQGQDQISQVLSAASAGISTTPGFLVEKSGTVAAMKLHGMPVVVVSKPWEPRRFTSIALSKEYFIYEPGNLRSFLVQERQDSGNNTIENISVRFSQSLNVNNSNLINDNITKAGTSESAFTIS